MRLTSLRSLLVSCALLSQAALAQVQTPAAPANAAPAPQVMANAAPQNIAPRAPERMDRIKDLATFAGVRSNQLVGYGIVVGLNKTGDGNVAATLQSLQSMVQRFGQTITDINSRTISASVACTFTTGRWMTSVDTAALTTSGVPQNQAVLIPGEGIVAYTGMYILMSNQTGVTIYYG
jgi:hypothetical protein